MNAVFNRAGNLFLLLTGSFSLALTIQESFGLAVEREFWLFLGILCVLLWVSTVFRRGLFLGLPLSFLLLYCIYRTRTEDLGAEFQDLMDAVSGTYYLSFGTAVQEAASEPTAGGLMALLLVMFLVSAFIAVSLTAGSLRVSLIFLGTLPLFAACIAVNGYPSVLSVLGVAVFWLGVLLGGDLFRTDDAGGRAVFLGMLPGLAVLGVLLWFFRPSTYEADEQERLRSQRFDRIGNTISDVLDGEGSLLDLLGGNVSSALSGWETDDGSLDLTVPYDFSVQNHEIFVLKSDVTGSMYLRGRSFGDYTGTGWLAAADNTQFNALSFAGNAVSRAAGVETHWFQLEADLPYEALYLPYYSVTGGTGDVFVPAEGRTAYAGNFYLPTGNYEGARYELPGSLQNAEYAYRQYAHSYYTRLPDSTRSVMENICLQNGLNTGRADLVSAVADYVRSGSSYELGIGPYPDSDYAVYFLTVARRGYCVHFATAACALYRALGIPARVCEGFLVSGGSGSEVTVRGADAHAWVEVYSDGIGWLPIEVTASGGSSPSEPHHEPEQQQESSSAEPDPAESVPEAEDPEAAPLPSPDDQGPAVPDGSAGQEVSLPDLEGRMDPDEQNVPFSFSGEERRGLSRALKTVLIVLGTLAGGTALFFGRYRLLRVLRLRSLRDEDGKKRAVSLYRQALRVLSFGGEMPDDVLIPAERAVFSQHAVSEAELAAAAAALDLLTENVASGLSPWKRFLFRFLYGNE